MINTSLQVGAAVSLALISAVLSSADQPLVQGELLPNMQTAIVTFSVIAITGVVLTLVRLVLSQKALNRKTH